MGSAAAQCIKNEIDFIKMAITNALVTKQDKAPILIKTKSILIKTISILLKTNFDFIKIEFDFGTPCFKLDWGAPVGSASWLLSVRGALATICRAYLIRGGRPICPPPTQIFRAETCTIFVRLKWEPLKKLVRGRLVQRGTRPCPLTTTELHQAADEQPPLRRGTRAGRSGGSAVGRLLVRSESERFIHCSLNR